MDAVHRQPNWRKVERNMWVPVGKFRHGELLLADTPKQTAIMYEWEEGPRKRHVTVASFFWEDRFRLAREYAVRMIKAEARRRRRSRGPEACER